MTFFLGDANVHNLPPAVVAQDATQAAAQLRNSFGRLSSEIVQVVVTAVLNALGLGFLIPVIGNTNNQIQNIANQTNAIVGGLQGALQGLLPAFIDNGDGTLTAIGNQVVSNGDGTLTVAVNAGTTLLNTVIDNGDGTLMSVATALNSKIQSFGTHSAAINDLNTALGAAGLSHPGQLVTALQGVIPAILDNGDGTLTTLSSQITHNFDGTYTYVAQQAQQGAANLNGLIDNLDGTLMPFYHAVSQGYNNVLGGLLHAFTGNPVTGTTTTQAQQAQVTSAAAALQQRLATIGNGAEEQVDVEFSAYTNGAIPGVFTGFSGNNGSAPTISGGVLTVTGNNLSQYYLYNASTTLTDYQQITGTWATLAPGSGNAFPLLFGRINGAATVYIQAFYTAGSGWTLNGWAPSLIMSVTFSDTFTTGVPYSLVCGDPMTNNPYKFQILKNGTPLSLASVTTGDTSQPAGQLYYIDTSHATTVGGSNRSCGLGFQIASGTNGTISMSNFLFQDTTASVPSVLVTTSESTSSTTYVDLATTSDAVVVNIGTSGLALVALSANVMNGTSTGDSFMSFALSGANTLAAADTNAIMYQAWTAGAQGTFGAPILLTGLTQGLTTFKAKYRSTGSTATFANRRLAVVAL